jgi:FKBP-type peptidyl-prolyl cis-trans isomerase FkpA
MKLIPFVVLCALLAGACNGSDTPTAPSGQPPANSVPFSSTDLRVGTGVEASAGRNATVNYTLWLYNTAGVDNKGSLIESSVGGAPLGPFPVGTTGLIPGFSQCVLGMKVGGLRRCNIPPNLAYGSQGSAPSIPPNATLIFELELLAAQ